MKLSAVVLAAGHGTRMKSELPKPLHRICGRSMLVWVLRSLGDVEVEQVVIVVGHRSEQVVRSVSAEADDLVLDFVEQLNQRGTGDAASVGLTGLRDDSLEPTDILVLPGDAPLLRPETIAAFVAEHRRLDSVCTMLTARLDDPTGYGRVIRDGDGRVAKIVEQTDGTDAELAVDEVNTSIYCFRRSMLTPALRRIQPDNAQGEFYLTDVIEVLRSAGHAVHAYKVADPAEVHGVNDRVHLAEASGVLQGRIAERWLQAGISIPNPGSVHIDAEVDIGPDTVLLPGSFLGTGTAIGEAVTVGPNTELSGCAVGDRAIVEHSRCVDAEIGPGARVGPFAALGPGASVAADAVTGPFYAEPAREDGASRSTD